MERLTKRIEEYVFVSDEKRAYERLASYEDTGLTPEQIFAMDEEYAKLAKELGEYKRLEEQGLLLKLPFVLGQAIYWIATECDVKHAVDACNKYDCDDCPHNNALIVVEDKVREQHIMRFIQGTIQDKLGKHYFLTKEEAERYCGAFKKMSNADRIRKMTDEELAEYISDLIKGTQECCEYSECFSDWLNWLQKEVE